MSTPYRNHQELTKQIERHHHNASFTTSKLHKGKIRTDLDFEPTSELETKGISGPASKILKKRKQKTRSQGLHRYMKNDRGLKPVVPTIYKNPWP